MNETHVTHRGSRGLGWLYVRLRRMNTSLGECPEIFKEVTGILAALVGRGQRESRLLAPFYNV